MWNGHRHHTNIYDCDTCSIMSGICICSGISPHLRVRIDSIFHGRIVCAEVVDDGTCNTIVLMEYWGGIEHGSIVLGEEAESNRIVAIYVEPTTN